MEYLFTVKSLIVIFIALVSCDVQSIVGSVIIPKLSPSNFRNAARAFMSAPGRVQDNSDILIIYYTTNVSSPTIYRVNNLTDLLNNPDFNIDRNFEMYIPGYIELRTDESVLTMIQSHIDAGNYTVTLLDWSNLSFGNYVTVTSSMRSAATYVCEGIQRLLLAGLPRELLHLVGHSLGAHMASYIAKCLSDNGSKLPRITGLDPAGPGFYPPVFGTPISSTDADYVDIIYTDMRNYGALAATGKANFFPNGGHATQPGCPPLPIPLSQDSFCNHWRSWMYYAESVRRPVAFLARECSDETTFLEGGCNKNTIAVMGIDAPTNISGNFYLKTGSESPFGLGDEGATSIPPPTHTSHSRRSFNISYLIFHK